MFMCVTLLYFSLYIEHSRINCFSTFRELYELTGSHINKVDKSEVDGLAKLPSSFVSLPCVLSQDHSDLHRRGVRSDSF